MSSRHEDAERGGREVSDPAPTVVQDTRGATWPGTGGTSASGGSSGSVGSVGSGPGTGQAPPPRQGGARQVPRAEPRPAAAGRRRARLAIRRLDPWSVFVMALLLNIFLGIVLVVAVGVLYALLDGLGVLGSVNDFAQELDLVGQGEEVLALDRLLAVTAVVAAVDVVLLTVLATLGAFLYNLCATFTGGLEVTLSERE